MSDVKMCHQSFVYLKRIKVDYNYTDQTLLEIADLVEKTLVLPKDSVKGVSRVKAIADARKIFCLLATRFTKKSLKTIGSFINRDHSTVIHNRDTSNDLLEFDKSFIRKYHKCLTEIKRINISYE